MPVSHFAALPYPYPTPLPMNFQSLYSTRMPVLSYVHATAYDLHYTFLFPIIYAVFGEHLTHAFLELVSIPKLFSREAGPFLSTC